MKTCLLEPWSNLIVSLLLALSAQSARAAQFFWKDKTSGDFTDPKRWNGPDSPNTRIPGAGDDAVMDRGPQLTVTIPGDQATRELLPGDSTLNISGNYTVEQISAYSSLVTFKGGGQLNATLWLMGAQGVFEGSKAKITTLQPLGASPPSELVVRNGAEVTTQALDKSRGALKVTVEGAGAVWKHTAQLPFVEIVLKANGRVEVPSTDVVYVNADGSGAQLTASGRFSGYGRIANGARIECAEGFHPFSGGFTTIDGGTWAVKNTFINDSGDLTIQNGGVLSANNVSPGQFSSLTLVDGAGSRMTVADLLSPSGIIQLKHGGSLTSAKAQLDKGGVYAETGGTFTVTGDIFSNNGLNLVHGGLLTTDGVFLADTAGRGAGMLVQGSGSVAQISSGLAVGERGQGTLTIRDKGKVTSRSGGLGVFAGSDGQATVSGALSEWTINPALGSGALLVGGAGRGVLTVDFGGSIRVTGLGDVTVGRDAGSDGTIRVLGFGSSVDVGPATMTIGQKGKGTVTVDSSARLQADMLIIGQSALDNRVTATGQDTILGVLNELVVGDGGRGTLLLQRGVQAIVKRLVVGRHSVADNLVSVEEAGTKLSGSGRIDIGEQNGRGRFEMFNTAEARPSEGLSVGIYDGSHGTLLLDRNAFVETPGDAIIGGGASSQARATIRGGGSLGARDIVILAKSSGSATMDVANQFSVIDAAGDLQIGFLSGTPGATLLRASDGAFLSAGINLLVGKNGRLEVTGARVKVGAADYPPIGTVRVGPGGFLKGAGRVQGRIEVLSGGGVSPGASPGTLTIEGAFAPQAGARLEIEVSGSTADTGHDVLHVTGTATLGGTLAVKFVNGFAPKAGQSYAFLQADGGISGSFANVEITGVAAGFSHRLVPAGASGLNFVAQNNATATSAPLLEITRSGASISISWPATGSWILETTADLSKTWLPVTVAPVPQNDRYGVTLATSATAAFYRLRP